MGSWVNPYLLFFFNFFVNILRTEFKALYILGNHSTTELHLRFCFILRRSHIMLSRLASNLWSSRVTGINKARLPWHLGTSISLPLKWGWQCLPHGFVRREKRRMQLFGMSVIILILIWRQIPRSFRKKLFLRSITWSVSFIWVNIYVLCTGLITYSVNILGVPTMWWAHPPIFMGLEKEEKGLDIVLELRLLC